MLLRNALVVIMAVILSACSTINSESKFDKRQKALEMKQEVLTKLYEQKPDARAQIKAASGHAVFSNANINLLFLAAGTGYGVVTDGVSGRRTYMNMAEGGVGLGFGVKDYRIVMVFHSEKAMTNFVENGWTFGGNADAAAKAGDKGASVEGEAYYGDVTVYTFTEAGLAFQATIKGTRFWKDDELN